MGGLVILGLADVEPVFVDGEADDGVAGFDDLLDEVGHVEGCVGVGEMVEGGGFEEVDACVDEAGVGGLFAEGGDAGAFAIDDAVGDAEVVLADGDGEGGFVVCVKGAWRGSRAR